MTVPVPLRASVLVQVTVLPLGVQGTLTAPSPLKAPELAQVTVLLLGVLSAVTGPDPLRDLLRMPVATPELTRI